MAGGQAPYQPLLLLSLLEMIDQKIVIENKFRLSPELISIFIKYREKLSNSYYQADLAQPFYYMSNKKDSFWHLVPKPGHDLILTTGMRLNTLKKLRASISYGCFDDELFSLLQSTTNRNILSGILIDKWFPSQLEKFQQLLQIKSFDELRYLLRESGGAIYSMDEMADELKNEVRDAAFRKNLIALYDQRCAFCHLRVIGMNQDNIVDGAHIKPFAIFRDNRYENGLALCKNHHWAFDRGWFGVSNDYRILIPQDRFQEESPENSKAMKDFSGQELYLPLQERFRPSTEALSWHREKWMIA